MIPDNALLLMSLGGIIIGAPALALAAVVLWWHEHCCGQEPQETAGNIELIDDQEVLLP